MMKLIKTIALALAISTGACTVQAVPLQQMQEQGSEFVSMLGSWAKLGVAGFAAYWTVKGLTVEQSVKLINFAFEFGAKRDTKHTGAQINEFRTQLNAWLSENKDALTLGVNIARPVSIVTLAIVYRFILAIAI